MKKQIKIIILLILVIMLISISIKPPKEEEKIDEEEVEAETVHITASIKMQDFQLTVYPEKRVPPTNNWSTIIDFRIVNSSNGNLLFQTNLTTNNLGTTTYILGPAEDIPSGNHRVYIKGISHLTKRYDNIPFQQQHENFDFTPYGDLLAGETNHANDDFVNSLDISSLVSEFLTADYTNDLNQDSIVDHDDIEIQIFNLYTAGDV